MNITVEPATLEHIPHIAGNLRPDDWQELIAVSERSAEFKLVESISLSEVAWVALADGVPGAIFGVGEISPEVGAPWLIGTPLIDKHSRLFLRHSRPYVEQMQTMYHTLFNMADQRNTKTLAWLKWLGFTLHDPVPYGRFSLPFIPFSRYSNV